MCNKINAAIKNCSIYCTRNHSCNKIHAAIKYVLFYLIASFILAKCQPYSNMSWHVRLWWNHVHPKTSFLVYLTEQFWVLNQIVPYSELRFVVVVVVVSCSLFFCMTNSEYTHNIKKTSDMSSKTGSSKEVIETYKQRTLFTTSQQKK